MRDRMYRMHMFGLYICRFSSSHTAPAMKAPAALISLNSIDHSSRGFIYAYHTNSLAAHTRIQNIDIGIGKYRHRLGWRSRENMTTTTSTAAAAAATATMLKKLKKKRIPKNVDLFLSFCCRISIEKLEKHSGWNTQPAYPVYLSSIHTQMQFSHISSFSCFGRKNAFTHTQAENPMRSVVQYVTHTNAKSNE